MATCKKNGPAPVKPPPPTYTLVLSEDEAITLMDVSEHIGGSAAATRRCHMDAIGTALTKAGVIGLNGGESTDIERERDALYFTASRRKR